VIGQLLAERCHLVSDPRCLPRQRSENCAPPIRGAQQKIVLFEYLSSHSQRLLLSPADSPAESFGYADLDRDFANP
jgi:hypothetical protein